MSERRTVVIKLGFGFIYMGAAGVLMSL